MRIIEGDCIEQMKLLPANSVDSVVCDPPYNLSFMNKPWDAYNGHEDAGFCYWLAGLIDGEGHFGIKEHTRGSHAPFFALKLRADEEGTLERIRRTVGAGTITLEKRDGANDMARWIVQDKAGCQRLVDLLDKYPLRAKKAADYWTWRLAVCEWTERPRGNRWTGAADNTRMAALREQLMSGRAYKEIAWSGHEFQDWSRLWAEECLRVLRPGGHILAFGGTRTWHRLAVAIEDAGFEIRDSIAWLYGSGFPKSQNVSKAIDKAAGAERKVIGESARHVGKNTQRLEGLNGTSTFAETPGMGAYITAAATPEAQRWEGWGTALKPAFEPVVVGRKPLDQKTVAANVLKWGCGAINIDGSRIGYEEGGTVASNPSLRATINGGNGGNIFPAEESRRVVVPNATGRFPANVILDESQAEALDKQSGALTSGKRKAGTYRGLGYMGSEEGEYPAVEGDSGGASRFFRVVKTEGATLEACPINPLTESANTAEQTSSPPSPFGGSVPSGAATSERPGTPTSYPERSTPGTPTPSRPTGTDGTPRTTHIDSEFSPGQQLGRPTPTLSPATAGSLESDTTRTTANPSTLSGTAAHITSSDTSSYTVRGDQVLPIDDLESRFTYCAKAPKTERPVVEGVAHETVKPLALMRYLVKLVTPPGGTVLDPFAGSGTTLEACIDEGFDCITIERDPRYLPLIKVRMERALQRHKNDLL